MHNTCPEPGLIEKNSSVENHIILSNIILGGSDTANKKYFIGKILNKACFWFSIQAWASNLVLEKNIVINISFREKLLS